METPRTCDDDRVGASGAEFQCHLMLVFMNRQVVLVCKPLKRNNLGRIVNKRLSRVFYGDILRQGGVGEGGGLRGVGGEATGMQSLPSVKAKPERDGLFEK